MYYINKNFNLTFEEAERRIVEELKNVGFGILTEIDMQATMKKKLDKDILPYKILGACNPNFAYKALQEEEKIGILLPCNVTIIQKENGSIDVSIMNPEEALNLVNNKNIESFATEVKELLKTALDKV